MVQVRSTLAECSCGRHGVNCARKTAGEDKPIYQDHDHGKTHVRLTLGIKVRKES
jgi:hypothetical protein